MDRIIVWKEQIEVELEVPDHEDGPYQISRVTVTMRDVDGNVIDGGNSVKIDTGGEVVFALVGQFAEHIAGKLAMFTEHIDASSQARIEKAKEKDEW